MTALNSYKYGHGRCQSTPLIADWDSREAQSLWDSREAQSLWDRGVEPPATTRNWNPFLKLILSVFR